MKENISSLTDASLGSALVSSIMIQPFIWVFLVGVESVVPPDLITRIEQEVFSGYQPCDLVLTDQAWPYLDPEITQDRAWYTISKDADSQPLAETLRLESSCVILVAPTSNERNDKLFLESVVFERPESAFVLLKVDPDANGPYDCSMEGWNTAKVNFVVDLTKANKMTPVNICCFLKTETPSPSQGKAQLDAWDANRSWIVGQHLLDQCTHPLQDRLLHVSYGGLIPFAIRQENSSDPSGIEPDMFRVLLSKFNAKSNFIFTPMLTKADPITGRFNQGGNQQVRDRWVDIAIGNKLISYATLRQNRVDHLGFVYYVGVKVFSRPPLPLTNLFKPLMPFQKFVWILVYVTLIALAGLMALIYHSYRHLPNSKELLARKKVHWSDFLLLPLSKFVEPDPLPWFLTFSTGKIVTLMWSIFTLIIIFAYQCNLRANLVNVYYEKPLETLDDVLERDQNIYMALQYHHAFFGAPMHEFPVGIQKLLMRRQKSPNKGIDDLTKHPGLNPEAEKDVRRNGAAFVHGAPVLAYRFNTDRDKALKNYQWIKEDISFGHYTWFVQRFSTWQGKPTMIVGQLLAMGLEEKFYRGGLPLEALEVWRPQKASHEMPLALEHIELVLYFLLIGLTLSLGTFIAELCF